MKNFLTLTFAMTLLAHADELTDDLVKAHERAIAAMQDAPKSVDAYKPRITGDITELLTDAAAILKQLPFVKSVDVHKPEGKPTHRIIMFANWHTVPEDLLREDIESQEGGKFSDLEWHRIYWIHLLECERIQAEQLAALRCLIRHHELKSACLEGLTDDENGELAILAYSMVPPKIADSQEWIPMMNDLIQLEGKQPEQLAIENSGLDPLSSRKVMLTGGPLIRLLASKELKAVHPTEDMKTLDAVTPQFEDGKPLFDPKALEAREDVIVRNTLKHGPVAILLLGGSHDLRDNLKRIEPGAELIVVKVKAYSEIAD